MPQNNSSTSETFERRGGVAGKHGLVFQNQVASLLLARAIALDPEGARLGAEHAHAGCFDDVSVRVRHRIYSGGDGGGAVGANGGGGDAYMLLLLQLKHRNGGTPVGSQALRGDKGSFCVRKYYRSYVEDVDVRKLGADPTNTYYVLYTNAALPEIALGLAEPGRVPEAAASLLNSGCCIGGRPKLLRAEADHLEGESRGPEFQNRFVWMGEQAGEAELRELLRQEVFIHVGRLALDAGRRAGDLERAVESWYEDTGHVDYLSSQWVPWKALQEVDPPLLRGLRFGKTHIARLLKNVAATPAGGVLHLSCDTHDVELRAAKIANAASIRPLLVGRLVADSDVSDAEVAISMWERGWCRELALVFPEKSTKTRQAQNDAVSSLGKRLLSILEEKTEPSRPQYEEGRALIILAPPSSKGVKEHPLIIFLRDHLMPRELWTESTDSFAFNHLSREIRTSVLQVSANIQGRMCTLGELGQDHILDKAVRGDALAILLRAQGPLRIGRDVLRADEPNINLYIPRRVIKNIPVNDAIFRTPDANDVFLVKDVTKDELDRLTPPGAKVQLLDRQDPDTRFIACRKMSWTRFREFKSQNPARRCHFLKKVNGLFMWRHSGGDPDDSGRVTVVQKHLTAEGDERENNMAFVKGCESCTPFEEDLAASGVRTVLISGDPGAGKSSVLARVARSMAERRPCDWVIHLSLPDHTNTLMAVAEAMGEGGGDCAEVAAKAAEQLLLLASGMSREADESRDEEAAAGDAIASPLLHDRMWETGGLRVLIDAFDEISPDYTDVVIAIIKALQASCVTSLWVSSRQLLEERLEQELGVGAFSLKPLTFTDQKRFWVQYWIHELHSDESPDSLQERADQLLKWFGGKFRSQFRLNIPLHTSILAQTFGKLFLEGDFKNREKHHDILYIYDKFIKIKFDIYIRDKALIEANSIAMKTLLQTLYDDFMVKHKICALMETHLLEYLPQNVQKKMYAETEKFLGEIRKGSEKTGIIVGVKCGKPRFIHRTFAEYFAGIWLSENHKTYSGLLDAVLGNQFKFVKVVADQAISKKHPLHNAVINEDIDELKEQLRKKIIDLEEYDSGGRTALSLAAQKNSPVGLQMCEILLEKGAKMYGYKELFSASANQAWSNLRLLIKFINSQENSNPLNELFGHILNNAHRMSLITEEDMSMQKLYFDINWNIFSKKRSILHVAVNCGDEYYVRNLLLNGADPKITDEELNTPLHNAVQIKNEAIVDILLDTDSPVHPRNIRGETPLFMACSQGNISIVNKLLPLSANNNYRAKSGSTLLHASVEHSSIVELLLSHNYNINATDSRGVTILHEAVRRKNHDLVHLLVKRGANVHATNFQNCTPLFIAVTTESAEIVRTLLDAGALVSTYNSRGDTALHVAVVRKNEAIVSLLLNKGADPDIENMNGESPIDLATMYGSLEMQNLLKNRRKINITPQKWKAVAGVNHVPQVTLKQRDNKQRKTFSVTDGFNNISNAPFVDAVCEPIVVKQRVNRTSSSPFLPTGNENSKKLLVAVKNRNVQQVKKIAATLTKDPADWLAINNEGNTALHVAAKSCPAEVVSLLCARAPRQAIAACNASKATPSHLAATRKDHNVSLSLYDAGADWTAVDHVGDTPLHVACRLAVYKQIRFMSPRLPEEVFTLRNAQGDTPLHLALCLGESKEEAALSSAADGATLLICYEKSNVISRWQRPQDGARTERPTSRVELVKNLLLASPACVVRMRNAVGDTPLHVAARGRVVADRSCGIRTARTTWCADVVRLLMERGADVAATNERGDTVLHEMCRNPGEFTTVSTFLQAPNIWQTLSQRNKLESTPLHDAAEHCHDKDIVRLIVEKGGDPRMKNENGEMPFQVAERVGNIEVSNFLADLVRKQSDPSIQRTQNSSRSYRQDMIEDFLDAMDYVEQKTRAQVKNQSVNADEPSCSSHQDNLNNFQPSSLRNWRPDLTPPYDGSEMFYNSPPQTLTSVSDCYYTPNTSGNEERFHHKDTHFNCSLDDNDDDFVNFTNGMRSLTIPSSQRKDRAFHQRWTTGSKQRSQDPPAPPQQWLERSVSQSNYMPTRTTTPQPFQTPPQGQI